MLLDACFSCVRLPASLRGSVAIVDVIQKFAVVVLLLQNGAAVIQALSSFELCIIVILDSTFFQFVESVRVRPPVRHPHANPKRDQYPNAFVSTMAIARSRQGVRLQHFGR